MANTYSQINIQTIFSVKYRERILKDSFKDSLFKYMQGILKNQGHYPLAVNGHKDHVHLFFELNPTIAPADAVRTLKANSSKWINENNFLTGKFQWQEGYGAFSYSRSQRNRVIKYILNQEKHHQSKPFRKEYLDLLKKNDIDFDDHYVFEFFD